MIKRISALPNPFVLPILLYCFLFSSTALGQIPPYPVTPSIKQEVVINAARILEDNHVIPSTGEKMAASLREKLENGDYDEVSDGQELRLAISKTIYAIEDDWHLWINLSPEEIPEDYSHDHDNPSSEQLAEEEEFRLRKNYGFNRVERLAGNIGYIEYGDFLDAAKSENALAATMELLKNTGGLIIDLRQNGGGSPDMVSLFLSYFYEERNMLTVSIVYRNGSRIDEYRTRDELAGPRYGTDKTVYILNSEGTFSAAEAFAYDLQVRGRAKVIGEKTRGGSRPNDIYRLNERFLMAVPVAQSVHPITNSDWEGVGIIPDYEVPADEALILAQKLLLQQLIQNSKDSPARQERENALQELEAQLH